jgi:hypothetical protein
MVAPAAKLSLWRKRGQVEREGVDRVYCFEKRRGGGEPLAAFVPICEFGVEPEFKVAVDQREIFAPASVPAQIKEASGWGDRPPNLNGRFKANRAGEVCNEDHAASAEEAI